jgi:hypothetical protein
MKCTTIVRHPGAIALGCFFAGVTAYVLFKDVLDGAPVTTTHVLAMAALVAALASGHMALPELNAGRVLSALTLGLLFVGSTSYVVISSGARNAETAAVKVAAIAQVNADRARVEAERSKAQAMLDAERKAMARECASGKGRRCEGVQATVAVYAAAVAGHDAKLWTMKPAQRENAGYAHGGGGPGGNPGHHGGARRNRAAAQVIVAVRRRRDRGIGHNRVFEHRPGPCSKAGSGYNSGSEISGSDNSDKARSDQTADSAQSTRAGSQGGSARDRFLGTVFPEIRSSAYRFRD